MSYPPIKIDMSPFELFGDHFFTSLSEDERKAAIKALADGVIDDSDFNEVGFSSNDESFYSCRKSYPNDECHYANNYNFLRAFYFHMAQATKTNDRPLELSKVEADDYRHLLDTFQVEQGSYALTFAKDEDWLRGSLVTSQLTIDSGRALFVMHPYLPFDASERALEGIEREVAFAEEKNFPVVYLVEGGGMFGSFYLKHMAPTYFAYADQFGTNDVSFNGSEMVLTGGHVWFCLSMGFDSLMANRKSREPLSIFVPTDAVYSGTNRNYFRSESLKDILEKKSTQEAFDFLEHDFYAIYPRYNKLGIDFVQKTLKNPVYYNTVFRYRGEERVIPSSDPAAPELIFSFL